MATLTRFRQANRLLITAGPARMLPRSFQHPWQSFAVVAARCLGPCESEQWFRVRLHAETAYESLAAGLR